MPLAQVRIERLWGYLNPRVMRPLKLVLFAMELRGELDCTRPYHLGACQAVVGVLLEFQCERLRVLWNQHAVLAKGGGRSLGTPEAMRATAVHPGGRQPWEPGAVAAFEAARGAVEREPEWAAARDPLYGRAQEQGWRADAVRAAMGPLDECFADVLHRGGTRLRNAIHMYLSYV